MVIHDISSINEIGYCKKLANDMVIKNMPIFYTMDARIKLFEFKKKMIP